MTSTYEAIKALPGTSNWTAIHSTLRALNGGAFYDSAEALAASKGVRNAREAAMWMATSIVMDASRKSTFIPPSPHTLQEGGFLGGEVVVWDDKEIEASTTLVVIAAIRKVA